MFDEVTQAVALIVTVNGSRELVFHDLAGGAIRDNSIKVWIAWLWLHGEVITVTV